VFIWLRRAYQAVFLAFFLFLVLASTSLYIRGYDVQWFLELDPLVAVTTALSTHTLFKALWWSLPLIVLTLVFGRFFCSWVCPMGALHHFLGYLGRKKKPLQRIEQNAPRPSHKIKYAILAVMLGLAAAGSEQIGLLDPIASTWRGLSTSLLPAASNTAFGLYQGHRYFQWGTIITVVFFGALALNFVYPRFYCRVLCPLGAFLGLLSKFALFRISKDPNKCNDCSVCGAECQGAADPQGTVRATECMVCLNCTTSCKRGGLGYRFLPGLKLAKTTTDLSRRKWIAAGVAGVVAVPLARASDGVDPRPNPSRIRPPGALDEPDFLAKCLKCDACMKVCPTGGLQPALYEAGLEGFWSPILIPRLGYCEHSCTLCGQVCPTGAIRHLTVAEKVGNMPEKPPTRIGSAFFDKGRCLPWGYGTDCIVCEEVCPTSPKAIYFKVETITTRDGQQKTLKLPYVDLDHCTGCGICETRCPVVDRAGVRVSAANESRTPKSSMTLTGGKI
jgi:polyferredoxin/NAD-dependent dihydropyrimidine dehydrogenase PreA subunit